MYQRLYDVDVPDIGPDGSSITFDENGNPIVKLFTQSWRSYF